MILKRREEKFEIDSNQICMQTEVFAGETEKERDERDTTM
jgi:hypothetical protein